MNRLTALIALILLLSGCSCSSGRVFGATRDGGGADHGSAGQPPAPSGTLPAPSPTAAFPSNAPHGPLLAATSSRSTSGTAHLPVPSTHPFDPNLDWTGWALHPALPAGCRGMYVPDDVAKREKPLAWESCPASMGITCQKLVLDLDSDVWAFPGAGGVLVGGGMEPVALGMAYWHSKSKILETVLYDAAGKPIAALREDNRYDPPSAHFVPGVSRDGRLLYLHLSLRNCDGSEALLAVPADDPALLMYTARPTLSWSSSIVAHQDVQDVQVSGQIAGAMLVGAAAVGDLSTGKSSLITPPPGGGVDWWPYDIIGRSAFLFRGTPTGTSIWVSQDLVMAAPLIEIAGGSIGGFITDGDIMVWSEMTDEVDPASQTYARHDIYAAPYATDPAHVNKKWVGRVPTAWGGLGMNNGYVYGGDYTDTRRFYVLRLSDGKWWEIVMPDGWLPPRSVFFASPSEMWLVTGNTVGPTILRVPYSELTPRDYAQGGPP